MTGLIRPDYLITINGVSGYSGGGRQMIEAHNRDGGPAFELYALGLEQKHVPETQLYSGLTRRPILVPSVGHFRQGMLFSVPLHLDSLPAKPTGGDLHAALADAYGGCEYVRVVEPAVGGRLEARSLNGTNRLELFIQAKREAAAGGAGQSWQGCLWRASSKPRIDARPQRRISPIAHFLIGGQFAVDVLRIMSSQSRLDQ